MLYIHATGKLAKSLKLKLPPAPNEDEVDWLDCWYANVLDLNLSLDAILFTNAATKYSLVHPFDPREPLDYIVQIFRIRLQEITGRDLTNQHSEFQFCKTNSRKILGCMNGLDNEIHFWVHHDLRENNEFHFEDIEHRINGSIIGGVNPETEFRKMLTTHSSNFKPTKVPHLRVVK